MFFKTRYNLRNHLDLNSDWSPKSENLSAVIGGLDNSEYYEICLAVVEHVTVYYIHRDLCQEVKTLPEMDHILSPKSHEISHNFISTKNVTILPSLNSVTLAWQIDIQEPTNEELSKLEQDQTSQTQQQREMISVIWQISVRKFGSDNATQLFVLEDFNKTALLENNKQASASESAR